MSKSKKSVGGEVHPEVLYTLHGAARALQVSEKWLKEHLIYTKECRFLRRGQVYLILGSWLIEWVSRQEVTHEND
jgi:hypothetical protein